MGVKASVSHAGICINGSRSMQQMKARKVNRVTSQLEKIRPVSAPVW